ncbi:hypothetical protein [Caldimonas brevitalea]|uniref:Uncharacterized protein n=1 Tax=Caldimonas brevitalea TaxID=413882 RepID=A0A0G3BQP5_9BURK|nr:hypothetical protein [Caldimonas brevitalea]AKJ28850.1 hypothetical protein AAW51_2159 [Caldimonas brevitalea]
MQTSIFLGRATVFRVTAGQQLTSRGYFSGGGSVSPNGGGGLHFQGCRVTEIYDDNSNDPVPAFAVWLRTPSGTGTIAQNHFLQIEVAGTVYRTNAVSDFFQFAGLSVWRWNSPRGFVNGSTYDGHIC